MRTDRNRTALAGASRNVAQALEATVAPEFAHYTEAEKSAWAMAALIHCDVCRVVIALDECERDGGIARLLCMADIVSKLIEAWRWYNKSGTKLLREISTQKPSGIKNLNKHIEEIKKAYRIQRINKYNDYRDKLGYHYDAQALHYLRKFGEEDVEEFFDILKSFVEFSSEWTKITKTLIQEHHPSGSL
jgi:hypothetical protein